MRCGAFWRKARTHLGDAGFLVLMELDSPLTSVEIAGRAAQAGVAVRPVESVGESFGKTGASFSRGISEAPVVLCFDGGRAV